MGVVFFEVLRQHQEIDELPPAGLVEDGAEALRRQPLGHDGPEPVLFPAEEEGVFLLLPQGRDEYRTPPWVYQGGGRHSYSVPRTLEVDNPTPSRGEYLTRLGNRPEGGVVRQTHSHRGIGVAVIPRGSPRLFRG